MSHEATGSKAAEIAAQRVESIVAAAEQSATDLTDEAGRQAEEIRAKARADAERELEQARRKAVELDRDARKSANAQLEAAKKDAQQLREQTRRQIDGRVAAAEEAAAEVLEEARVLSSGLRQLGSLLQSQGERILRDVQAAHKRMQADLRVKLPEAEPSTSGTEASPRRSSPLPDSDSRATPEERAALERAASQLRDTTGGPARQSGRDNPFDDLDVPRWVER